MGVSKMDWFQWTIPLKWMMWGYHHFRKLPSWDYIMIMKPGLINL